MPTVPASAEGRRGAASWSTATGGGTKKSTRMSFLRGAERVFGHRFWSRTGTRATWCGRWSRGTPSRAPTSTCSRRRSRRLARRASRRAWSRRRRASASRYRAEAGPCRWRGERELSLSVGEAVTDAALRPCRGPSPLRTLTLPARRRCGSRRRCRTSSARGPARCGMRSSRGAHKDPRAPRRAHVLPVACKAAALLARRPAALPDSRRPRRAGPVATLACPSTRRARCWGCARPPSRRSAAATASSCPPAPVLIGHAAGPTPYFSDMPRALPRTYRTCRGPYPVLIGHAASRGPRDSWPLAEQRGSVRVSD